MKAALAIAFAVAAIFAGCKSPGTASHDYTPTVARFFLESTEASAGKVVLPVSGVKLAIGDKPVIAEGDIADVDLAQVDLGRCLLFRLTPAAARDCYRLTGANQGRRLVLMLNGVAIGARRIEAPIADGAVFMFVEVTDPELAKLAVNLKKTTAEIQRELAQKK